MNPEGLPMLLLIIGGLLWLNIYLRVKAVSGELPGQAQSNKRPRIGGTLRLKKSHFYGNIKRFGFNSNVRIKSHEFLHGIV